MIKDFSQKSDLLERHTPVCLTQWVPPPPPGPPPIDRCAFWTFLAYCHSFEWMTSSSHIVSEYAYVCVPWVDFNLKLKSHFLGKRQVKKVTPVSLDLRSWYFKGRLYSEKSIDAESPIVIPYLGHTVLALIYISTLIQWYMLTPYCLLCEAAECETCDWNGILVYAVWKCFKLSLNLRIIMAVYKRRFYWNERAHVTNWDLFVIRFLIHYMYQKNLGRRSMIPTLSKQSVRTMVNWSMLSSGAIYLSIDLSIQPSIVLSGHAIVSMNAICLWIYLSIYRSIYLSIYLCWPIDLSDFLSKGN